VTAASETLPDLSFRELAPREHLDRVGISSLGGVGHDAVQCRTTKSTKITKKTTILCELCGLCGS
jgi:hypothetical protein